MIDPNMALQNFKKKFDKMTYDEREEYLKKMGFIFDNESEKPLSSKKVPTAKLDSKIKSASYSSQAATS